MNFSVNAFFLTDDQATAVVMTSILFSSGRVMTFAGDKRSSDAGTRANTLFTADKCNLRSNGADLMYDAG